MASLMRAMLIDAQRDDVDHETALAMSHAAAVMSSTIVKSANARVDFFKIPGQGLSPVLSQPRHVQSEQR